MDDRGFQKINLKASEDVVSQKPMEASSSKRRRNQRNGKRAIFKHKKLNIVIGVIIVILIYSLIQAFSIYKQARKVEAQAKVAYQAVKEQDIAKTKTELQKTNTEIAVLDHKLHWLGFMKFIPLISGYYNDADHMIKASSDGVNAGIIASDALIPYADVLGLKGGGQGFTGGTAQDRIRLAVQTMGKVVPQIDKIEAQLKLAQEEMDKVNPNHYPPIGKLKKVRDSITQIKGLTDGAVTAVDQGKPLIKALPSLLGEDSDKKYLVLFQNDAELRPSGGFLTFYSIFSVKEGVISVDTSSDIYDLDDSISYHPKAPSIILKYLPGVSNAYIRDSNLSPDFVKSMDAFNAMYAKSSDKRDVDGIIAIDTHFLVNVINILGEVDADGLKFTAQNDPHCDCPQVVFALENEISRPVNYIKTNRKGLLGDLMLATLDKALTSSPKLYWGRLFQQFVVDANEKNVLFYLYDKDAQQGIEALNWAGRVKPFDGDYLYVNDANFGGQKSNLFVTKTLKVEYTTSKDGAISKKITMEYENPKPYSNCSLEAGGLCLNATLRNYQRVLVPKGSVLDDSKGSQVKVGTSEDLGKTVFVAFFTVNPLGKADMTYTYTLPFKVAHNDKLPVLIQKQPGVDNIPTTIFVNGKQVDSFDLRTDKELELNVY
jgi:cell division protein FtsB